MNNREKDKIIDFQEFLDYKFRNEDLLKQALTTPLLGNEKKIPHYDVLETLGDAVIKLALILKLFDMDIQDPGKITKTKAMLENDEILSFIANKYFNLQNYIYKTKEQEIEDTKILADVIEAVSGALYLDSNLDIKLVVKKIIDPFYKDMDKIIENSSIFNKNKLLEYIQKDHKITPKLLLKYESSGPDHNPFWIAKNPKFENVSIDLPKNLKSKKVNSKKEAELDLYLKILKFLKENP